LSALSFESSAVNYLVDVDYTRLRCDLGRHPEYHCPPQILRPSPATHSRRGLQSVFVVKAAQNRPRCDVMARRKMMTVGPPRTHRCWLFRNPGSQAAVGPATIVMPDPFVKDSTEMCLIELKSQGDRDEEVTGEHASRVVLDKRAPSLRSGPAAP